MVWPNATDYNAAVQNPQLCFRDEDLRHGQAVGDCFGLPRPYSGNFADVYQIQSPAGQNWAVKCFLRPVAGLRPRYHAISEHLRQSQLPFMVEFHFLDEGIRIGGQWYPLLKMRWVEGFRLNEFLQEHLHRPAVLDRLAQMWLRLAQELRDAGMAHGDLQHGNVLLAPGNKSSALSLKLVDYDGMFVPALANYPSEEVGHPNYQHPRRAHEGGYGRDMDRFALLLIYTALRCLRRGGEALWQRYDNQENLLFREEDFRQPTKSPLLRELWNFSDREIRNLVGHLLLASQGPLRAVPLLDDLVNEGTVRPLSDSEEERINDLLDDGTRSASDERGHVNFRYTETPIKDKTADKIPNIKTRSTSTSPRAADPTVEADALTDTKPIVLGTQITPATTHLSQTPPSLAETEEDTQPAAAVDQTRSDIPAHVDLLAPMRLHPAWMVTLSLIALISFLVISVMMWSSTTQPKTAESAAHVEKNISNIPKESKSKTEQESIVPKRSQADARPKIQPEETRPKSPQADLLVKTYSEDANPKTHLEGADSKQQPAKQQPHNKPHGLQEIVHFHTVDHLTLAGTLYHGWKGKEGMTVLMLHDLGRNRSTSGWKRLAEALQTEGHTVLTFDFRGHGDSRKVSPPFWKYPVNKYLPLYVSILPAEKQPKTLQATDLPPEYRPWLIEDIAAARTYLDVRHDDPSCPVNTFNLVLIGAGQAAALGSLWLATEGLRYNGSEIGDKILLKFPEKLSVLQAIWIGMADPLNISPFEINSWLQGAHDKPVVPITFIYGDGDLATADLLALPIRKKFGKPLVIPQTRQSGQDLLDKDAEAAKRIQQYLVKTLRSLPPPPPPSVPPLLWVPRKIKTLCSFWRMESPGRRKQVRWFEAKRVGEETLLPVPFHQLGIPIRGLEEPHFILGETE